MEKWDIFQAATLGKFNVPGKLERGRTSINVSVKYDGDLGTETAHGQRYTNPITPGINYFVHKGVLGDSDEWIVSEYSTGKILVREKTKHKAIEEIELRLNGRALLGNITLDQLNKALAEAKDQGEILNKEVV